MIFTAAQVEALNTAAQPLMDFLTKHCHPHCTIIVDSERAEVLECLAGVRRGETFPPSAESPGKVECCPKCSQPGVFIRTRLFENYSTADVWMCNTPACSSYQLYWHKDHPAPGTETTYPEHKPNAEVIE